MDKFIKSEASELIWKNLKEVELKRAFTFCRDFLRSPLTLEEFRNVWYSESSDKKGAKHLSNMCMSIFQGRKASAGNSFEKSVESLHSDAGIAFLKQKHVDNENNIHDKKPKTSSHKVDYIIQRDPADKIADSLIISAKSKLRERWRQDLCHIGKCKKVIILTKEVPNQALINSITGYDTILVFPDAPLTKSTWSFEEYVSRMKLFQKTGSYCLA
jgi:hypothetical protein